MRRTRPQNPLQVPFGFWASGIRLRVRRRDYWERRAHALGYNTLEDALREVYRQSGGNVAETARRFRASREAITRHLRALGEPIGRPGGSNNPRGRQGNPEKRYEAMR